MKIDLLFPVYNESEVIIAFCRELEAALELFLKSEEIGIFPEIDLEIIFIDDGSTDDSVELLSNFNFSLPVRIISLSRNFGHQPAVWAGIENSRSDSHVIVMDCDLQDPPSEISNIILEFQKGNEIVLMRRKSSQDKWAKKASANLFYLLQRKIANEEVITNV